MKTIDDLLETITTKKFEWAHVLTYTIFKPSSAGVLTLETGTIPADKPWELPSHLSGTFSIRIRGTGYETLELNNFNINIDGMKTTLNIPLGMVKDKFYEDN